MENTEKQKKAAEEMLNISKAVGKFVKVFVVVRGEYMFNIPPKGYFEGILSKFNPYSSVYLIQGGICSSHHRIMLIGSNCVIAKIMQEETILYENQYAEEYQLLEKEEEIISHMNYLKELKYGSPEHNSYTL